MKKLFSCLLAYCLFSPAYAESNKNNIAVNSVSLEGLPPPTQTSPSANAQYLAKITDGKGQVYFIIDETYLNRGFHRDTFYYIRQDKPDDTTDIYESVSDPSMGGCYEGKQQKILTDRNIKPDSIKFSYVDTKVIKGTTDATQNENAILLIKEQDCATKNYRINRFVISPQQEGLNITSAIDGSNK